MARAPAIVVAALLLGSLALASGFVVSPSIATLNRLTVQRTIHDLGANKQELNPYGLVLIQRNSGILVKGNFLATQWNDADNNPGQGRTILQVTPQGDTTPFATIPNTTTIQQDCGAGGDIGLTMAIAILSKGLVIVGSTPVPKTSGGIAGPGCLIVLDTSGNILATHAANEPTSTNGVMTGGGPWAFAIKETQRGSVVNLYVSYVLGNNPQANTNLTGVAGGKVVRYGLQVPGNTVGSQFWGVPDIIASGFGTVPAQITGGVVGPTGLLFVDDRAHNDRLFIANNLNSSVVAVPNPGACFTRPAGQPRCAATPHVWGGLVNGPIGLTRSPTGTIVGANGNIGTLFEFRIGALRNDQIADQLVDNTPPTVGAGTLFNVLFLDRNTLLFNDDGQNQFIVLKSS